MSVFLPPMKEPRVSDWGNPFAERILKEVHKPLVFTKMHPATVFPQVLNSEDFKQLFVFLEVIEQGLLGIASPVRILQPFISASPLLDKLSPLFIAFGA